MRPVDLRRALQKEPFRPFRLWVLEQTAYEVRHPEMVAVGFTTVQLTLRTGEQNGPVGEREFIISINLISKLELL